MPELPEVETIARDLKKEIIGRKIIGVKIVGSYKVLPSREVYIRSLINLQINSVERLAKVIVVTVERDLIHAGLIHAGHAQGALNQHFLTFHLAMTGRILLRKVGEKEDSHLRVRFTLDNKTEIRFCDVRMFGYTKVLNKTQVENLKLKYGPTPFNKNLTPKKLIEILAKRKTQIKRALLEQDLISGLGNIYANDALWMARIHPETLTNEITEETAEKLIAAMRDILKEAVAHKGSTLGDGMYVDIYGEPGIHQNYFRIYGKENKPCIRCKTTIKSLIIGGRSTFFCSNCQQKVLKQVLKLV